MYSRLVNTDRETVKVKGILGLSNLNAFSVYNLKHCPAPVLPARPDLCLALA